MKKWISRYTETVSFWIMLAALLCFGLAFIVSTWKNPTPPYHLLILLFLPAVLYGILTWMEIRWKYGSVAAGIGGILAIPILLTCFFFWIGIGLVSQSSENPAYYPRVYRFHRDLPGMEYFPAEIPEDAEDVVFRYSNIIFGLLRSMLFGVAFSLFLHPSVTLLYIFIHLSFLVFLRIGNTLVVDRNQVNAFFSVTAF